MPMTLWCRIGKMLVSYTISAWYPCIFKLLHICASVSVFYPSFEFNICRISSQYILGFTRAFHFLAEMTSRLFVYGTDYTEIVPEMWLQKLIVTRFFLSVKVSLPEKHEQYTVCLWICLISFQNVIYQSEHKTINIYKELGIWIL